MCPDQGSNLQPWLIGTMLQSTELLSQGSSNTFYWPAQFQGVWKEIMFPDERSSKILGPGFSICPPQLPWATHRLISLGSSTLFQTALEFTTYGDAM